VDYTLHGHKCAFVGSQGISVIDTQIWGESVSLRRTLSPQIWVYFTAKSGEPLCRKRTCDPGII